MKLNRLTLTVFAIGCVLLSQQAGLSAAAEPGPSAPEPTEAQPQITFEKPTLDLGEIGPGTKHLCEFNFTNTGTGLLKIKKVDATCGCTVPRLPKKEYAPGETGTLKVYYHSGKLPGRVNRQLHISSNDRARPRLALSIKATIVTKIKHEPKRLNLLLNKENAGCPEITLTSLDNQAFAIAHFKSTSDCITADVNSSVKATSFVIRPDVNIEKLQKRLNGRINIGLTHPQCDTVIIPFSALPIFKLNPPSIVIFNAEPNKPVTKDMWVLNNYNEDFEIESTSSEKNIIKVLGQEKLDSRYKFRLEITPPAAKGEPKRFSDTFYINIKNGTELKILCRGFYSKKRQKK